MTDHPAIQLASLFKVVLSYILYIHCDNVFMSAAPPPPSGVSVSQNGLNSLLVSWTSGEPAVTGYIISYQTLDGGHSDSVTNETATSTIITGLMTGATYSISIVATSSTLPSTKTTAVPDITIGIGLIVCVVFILMSPQSQPPSP